MSVSIFLMFYISLGGVHQFVTCGSLSALRMIRVDDGIKIVVYPTAQSLQAHIGQESQSAGINDIWEGTFQKNMPLS